jgi:23S rRNA (uridine2552-2'-O)-methyltransferase
MNTRIIFSSIFKNNYSTKVPNNLKGKKKSSQEWLTRQLKDVYVEKSKKENYRSRSAYKIMEINKKHKLLNYGSIVIDIGAAPGGFSQVCVKMTNSDGKLADKPIGKVIGVDKLQIYPLEGVQFFGNTDFTQQTARDKILNALEGKKANCILSDMVNILLNKKFKCI